MNPLTKLFSRANKKQANIFPYPGNEQVWNRVGGSTAYSHYKDNEYENGYGSIKAIVNRFMTIEPYAMDANGKQLNNKNVIEKLYTPNTDMSAVDFREALGVMSLVHKKVYIRVHHRGLRVNEQSITGFTFLEGVVEVDVDERIKYRVGKDEFDQEEVIVLKNINPYDLGAGFSTADAAKRWTRLDDYIADYQAGFFENGAVPAGQFIVTAPTVKDFQDQVASMQQAHKGAGNNNNVTYTHRPIDTSNGKPLNAQIEWVPFNTDNSKLDLSTIFENVNKKIDSAYGVPASIRGVNDSNTYASVRVDQAIFIDETIRPFTMKIWSKFTHELNRITGGLGYAIAFDLDTPHIADEDKVNSERIRTDALTISEMEDKGYTLKSLVEAFDYPESYMKLKRVAKPAPVEQPTTSLTAEPEVVDDVENTPLSEANKGLKAKQLTPQDREQAENKVRVIVRNQLERQVERAVNELDNVLATKAYGDAPEEQDDDFIAEMLAVMLPILAIYGGIEHSRGVQLVLEAGLSTEDVTPYFITEAQREAYRDYLGRIATYFNEQTAEKIRNILGTGLSNGATRNELEQGLRSLVQEQFRIDRLATSEINRVESRAAVNAMSNIKDDTGYTIEKGMLHTGSDAPCEFCATLLDRWVAVDESIAKYDEVITGVDGGLYKNTWEDNFGHDIHANGHCVPQFRVRS